MNRLLGHVLAEIEYRAMSLAGDVLTKVIVPVVGRAILAIAGAGDDRLYTEDGNNVPKA